MCRPGAGAGGDVFADATVGRAARARRVTVRHRGPQAMPPDRVAVEIVPPPAPLRRSQHGDDGLVGVFTRSENHDRPLRILDIPTGCPRHVNHGRGCSLTDIMVSARRKA